MSELTPPGVDPQSAKPEVIQVKRVTFNYVLIAIVFLLTGIAIGVVIKSEPAASTSIDAAMIDQVVRRALADAGVGEIKEDMTQLVNDDPYLGEENAPIVIVEFSAYACPYCGRHFEQTFEPLLENYGQYIRYVYRDFPSINPNVSFPASMAANCALEQGKFWEYHDLLFSNQQDLGEAFFLQAAVDLELDTEAFTTCYQEQRYYDEVNTDFYDGLAMGISGTPSFYINGRFYSGAQPYQFFERVIQRELSALGIDAGV